MNIDPRSGFLASFGIIRKNGTYEPIHGGNPIWGDAIHNTVDSSTIQDRKILRSSYPIYTFNIYAIPTTNVWLSALNGSYILSGGRMNRQGGGDNLLSITNGNLLYFSNGTYVYKTNNVNAAICTISDIFSTVNATSSVGPLSATMYMTSQKGGMVGFDGNVQSSSFNLTMLSTNDNRWLFRSTGASTFSPAESAYTLGRIYAIRAGSGIAANFNMPIPIEIGVGDALVVNELNLGFTYTHNAPKSFSSTMFMGVSTSGTYQRMIKVDTDDTNMGAANRIWLISPDNAIPLPNVLGNDYQFPIFPISSINAFETLSATGVKLDPIVANGYIQSLSCYATVLTGGLTKQIAFGSTITTSAIPGVASIVNFDTPQLLSAGRVISIRSILKLIPSLP